MVPITRTWDSRRFLDDSNDSSSEYRPSECGDNRRDVKMSRAKAKKATKAHSVQRSRKNREGSVAPVVTPKGETSNSPSSVDPSEADEVHGMYDETPAQVCARLIYLRAVAIRGETPHLALLCRTRLRACSSLLRQNGRML